MDQSAINHHRKVRARWRQAWRLLWVVPAAGGSSVLALQQAGEWDPPTWLVWMSVFSGAGLIAAEGIIGIFRADRASTALESGDRLKFMAGCAVEIQQATGINVASLGVSLWVVFAPRRGVMSWARSRDDRARCLHRIERFRPSPPNATADAWPFGRGVIGACASSNEERFRDYRQLQTTHPLGSPEPSKAAWKALCKARCDDGFTKEAFVGMINRYEQVLAYPITDDNGRFVGCISVDVTAEPGVTHGSLKTQQVVKTVSDLAAFLRATAVGLAVRP